MKTLGGYNVKDFKLLDKIIDRNILEPLIYEGIVENCPFPLDKTYMQIKVSNHEYYEDVIVWWDKNGKCSNYNRYDCFINIDDIKKELNKENQPIGNSDSIETWKIENNNLIQLNIKSYNINDVKRVIVEDILNKNPNITNKEISLLVGTSERNVYRWLKKWNLLNHRKNILINE